MIRLLRMRVLSRLASLALLGGTVGMFGTTPIASADATNCDFGTPTADSYFINTVAAAEKPAWRTFEQSIRATGKLYLCGDFVSAPATLPAGPAGTVIRVRPIYPSPTGSTSFAMRVMYKTVMRDGTVVPATTVILVPRTHPTAPYPRHTVVWTHPTIGINATCRNALDLATILGAGATFDATQPNGILSDYLVGDRVLVMPDYIGIGAVVPSGSPGKVHPYFARETTGRSVIDAMKANVNLAAVTLADSVWAVLGYSEGGFAALATAEVFQTYGAGSGLNLRGALSMAGPGDIPGIFTLAGNTQPLPNQWGIAPDYGNRLFPIMITFGMQADRQTVAANGTGAIINPASYLSGHAYYAGATYLRDANPYVSLAPWEASMANAGEPWGSVNLSGPFNPLTNPQATPYAWVLDNYFQTQGTGPNHSNIGPYGSYSIPEPEKIINSCTDVATQVIRLLPGNEVVLKTPSNDNGRWGQILEANSLGTVATSVPIVMLFGQNDKIVPPSVGTTKPPGTSKVWIDKMCAKADNIQWRTYPGVDHGTLVSAAINEARSWISMALNFGASAYPGAGGC